MRIPSTFARRVCAAIATLVLAGSLPLLAQSTPALPLLPDGVAYDAVGNLYFADTNRHQVYESSLAGILTVVAGSGTQGFSGDGGAAKSAQLNSPQGLAIGTDGTLYIADTGNQRIRAVSNGQINTLAGSGTAGFAGDAGPAIAAELNNPSALAVDLTGALLLCDSANQRLRRVADGAISTVAGTGTQGFAGDGSAAALAQLDTPSGIAVGADGRIYIADSHNDRIRVIALDGTIHTVAGNGIRGYSGDGGPATAASLSLPRGVVIDSAGALIFADPNNQRLRTVDAKGTITTIAGSGVQGAADDATAASTATLDTPRGVAQSTFRSPVFADAHQHQVRERLGNTLYLPAGLAPLRSTIVTLVAPLTAAVGQATITTNVSGLAGTPQGTVQLLDGSSVVAQTSLIAGSASFTLATLTSGDHTFTAIYLGDGLNPAAASSPAIVTIGAGTATATANGATIQFGQAIPALTGTLSGVAADDLGQVSVVFATTATSLSPPGTFAITAVLQGPASSKYSLVIAANSGSMLITQATTLTVEQAIAQNSYAGLPLVLTAGVASTTQGTPSGTVTFNDGTSVIATATLLGGAASATYLSPAAGNHAILATYSGDTDFSASSSQAKTTTIAAMPDFSLAGTSSQTITAGGNATYNITVSAQPAPFTGVVYLSASGLPPGATATFSPPQIVPGAGSATTTMTIQTVAASARFQQQRSSFATLAALFFVPLWVCLGHRRRRQLLLAILLIAAEGCGARSISTATIAEQAYTLKVTGTSTDLAGSLVVHSTTVTLILR